MAENFEFTPFVTHMKSLASKSSPDLAVEHLKQTLSSCHCYWSIGFNEREYTTSTEMQVEKIQQGPCMPLFFLNISKNVE